jgi:hypothetical protein
MLDFAMQRAKFQVIDQYLSAFTIHADSISGARGERVKASKVMIDILGAS